MPPSSRCRTTGRRSAKRGWTELRCGHRADLFRWRWLRLPSQHCIDRAWKRMDNGVNVQARPARRHRKVPRRLDYTLFGLRFRRLLRRIYLRFYRQRWRQCGCILPGGALAGVENAYLSDTGMSLSAKRLRSKAASWICRLRSTRVRESPTISSLHGALALRT